jgi:hypothetical protein
MASNFKHLVRELNGWVKPLPSSLCPSLINKALESIYDEHDWACLLIKNGYIIIPKAITTGLISVSKFSNIITINAALKTLLDIIEADINQPRVVGRQIRIKAPDSVQARILYNITNYDSINSQLTIDPIYMGDDVVNGSFEIVKALIKPVNDILYNGAPITDFKSFDYIGDLRNRRRLYLDYNIDEHDPDRNNTGTPFALSPYGNDSSGNLIFELYPYDKYGSDKIYKVRLYRKGSLLVNDTDIPPQPFTDDLILVKARIKAYEWCEVNKSTKEELQKTNWNNLVAGLNSPANTEGYPELLEKAKRRDEEMFPRAYIGNMDDYNYFGLPHDMRDTLVLNF